MPVNGQCKLCMHALIYLQPQGSLGESPRQAPGHVYPSSQTPAHASGLVDCVWGHSTSDTVKRLDHNLSDTATCNATVSCNTSPLVSSQRAGFKEKML